MRMKMALWTWLLFLMAFVSRGEAGECPKPELEGNVMLSDAAILKNNFPHGSEITLECAVGYVVDHGSDTITCFDGEWSKQELTCTKKDCGLPRPTPNLKYIAPNGTLFGAYIRPVCDSGYYLQGSSYRQCLANGWFGKAKCLLVTCGKIPEIPHSIIISKPGKEILEFNDVIEYGCEDTYILEGNRSVVCQENRKYSSLPQCKHENSVATCGMIPAIPHSIIVNKPEKEILNFKDVIEYSCEATYTLEGNRSVVCQQNGTYSSLPKCKGECPKPELEGNVVLSDSAILKNYFPVGSGVTLECAVGYVVDHGSDTITCLNGEWSEQELTCKKKDCGLPEPTLNLKYSAPNGTLFGAYIEPVCDSGYYLQGSSFRQCLAAGWTGRSECLSKGDMTGNNETISTNFIIIIAIAVFVAIVGVFFIVWIVQKRKGSYDTGEDERTKDALMQLNSFSYIQYQSKGP